MYERIFINSLNDHSRKNNHGNDIDIYLQPLIQELKELWHDAVQTLHSSNNETFKMRPTLMWTISDFPGFGNLS